MKRFMLLGFIILIFLIGLSVLLYPVISDYVNARNQSRVVAQYYQDTVDSKEEDFSGLWEAAKTYNQSLLAKSNRYLFMDEDLAQYNQLLSYKGSDVMGIVEIAKIGVKLPIYHGTSEGVLQVGTGHLEGSSLPVGGADTHAVITGHRGLPSSTLLTHLDKLALGDTFLLHILNATLTYQVDQILVVEPEEIDALAIEPGEDLCTLVTCTPYGINSHRLLVRGHRIPNAEAIAQDEPGENPGNVITTPALPVAQPFNTARPITMLIGLALSVTALVLAIRYRKILVSGSTKKGGKAQR